MMKVLEIHRRLIDCFAAQPLPGYPAIVRRYCHSGDRLSPTFLSFGISLTCRNCRRNAPSLPQDRGSPDAGPAPVVFLSGGRLHATSARRRIKPALSVARIAIRGVWIPASMQE